MKTKGIPKDKLTVENIRRDLRKKLWKSWLLLAVYVLTMIVEIYLFCLEPRLLFEETGGRYHWPGWVYLLLFLPVTYLFAREAWWLYTGYRKKPFIVKDTLVSSEGSSVRSSHSYRTYLCTLRFARYGEYSVPEKNHQWSKMYPLSCHGEYIYAMDGDEYYLVLSKLHSGKILLAYNDKLFELESDQV